MRTRQKCEIYKQLWKKIEHETLDVLQITEHYQEEDVLELQNQMEDEFTSIGRTPKQLPRDLVTGTSNSPTKQNQLLKNAFTINTSPMKRLRITSEKDQVKIPILESLKKKCRVNESNIPKTCLINSELYQIQAIIANPIQEPSQSIICQTSNQGNSQGREILKGGRYVGIPREEEKSE